MAPGRIEFVLEAVAGPAASRSLRAAALDHEVRDHPVEGQTVVVPPVRKVHEVGNGDGCFAGEQVQVDRTLGGVDPRLNVDC